MKTIHDETTRKELIERIKTISENSEPEWGRMTTYQMVKHCSQWEEMMLGKKKYKRTLLGLLFGKIALHDILKNENPLKRNLPTLRHFRISGTGDLLSEREKWIELIEEHARCSNPDFVHPFFGKLNKEQTGRLDYKHIDHHLRQFNG